MAMRNTRGVETDEQPASDTYGGMAPGSSNDRAVRHPAGPGTTTAPPPPVRQPEPEPPAPASAAAPAAPPEPAKGTRKRPAAGTKKRK